MMFRHRITVALIVISVGMGCALLIPDSFGLRDAAVYKVLPGSIDEWQGRSQEPSKEELGALARDTSFSKRLYFRDSTSYPGSFDYLSGTLVLSGDDMNNSIHRPERCLPAQGFGGIERSEVEIDVGRAKALTATRLKFSRQAQDGEAIPALMYYWFVGADYLTNDHYARTFYDMKFRILEGTNQRWAYLSFSTTFGDNRGDGIAPTTEAETDAMLEEVVRKTFVQVHKVDQLRGWSAK